MKKFIIAIIFVLIAPLNVMASWETRTCEYVTVDKTYIGDWGAYPFDLVVTESSITGNATGTFGGSGNYSYVFKLVYQDGDGIWYVRASSNLTDRQGTYGISSPYTLIDSGSLPDQCSINCNDEETQANTECGQDNWSWVDEETCEYECNTCLAEKSYLENICNGPGSYEIDLETCDGYCLPTSDCSQEYENKIIQCGSIGIKEWDNDTCTGECNECNTDADIGHDEYQYYCFEVKCYNKKVLEFNYTTEVDQNGCYQVTEQICECDETPPGDCDSYRTYVEQVCSFYDGIAEYECNPDPEYFDDKSFVCKQELPQEPIESNPPEEIPSTTTGEAPPEPITTAPDPNDPEYEPAPDPIDASDATEAEKTNNRLDSIKENTDTEIDQNNTKIAQMSDIINTNQTTASNTETIANNQGLIQSELSNLRDINSEGFTNITNAMISTENKNSEGFDNVTNAINDKEIDFSELGTEEEIPTLTGDEFDSSLPDDSDYYEYDNLTERGTESGESYLENHSYDEQIPITAQITAIGEPCISGDVTIHNQAVPISICFDKPWMLTGYSIMKVVMIAMGYLQTAILLNKALRS